MGNVDEASRQLVQCTYECLEKAISIGMHWDLGVVFPFVVLAIFCLMWTVFGSKFDISIPIFLISVKPGVRFREIGEVINRHATMSGFSVVMHNVWFAIVIHCYSTEDTKQCLVVSFSCFAKTGKIVLWSWYWRAVSLCP